MANEHIESDDGNAWISIEDAGNTQPWDQACKVKIETHRKTTHGVEKSFAEVVLSRAKMRSLMQIANARLTELDPLLDPTITSDAKVDAQLRELGIDPEALAKRGLAWVRFAQAQVLKAVEQREAIPPMGTTLGTSTFELEAELDPIRPLDHRPIIYCPQCSKAVARRLETSFFTPVGDSPYWEMSEPPQFRLVDKELMLRCRACGSDAAVVGNV